MNDGNVFGRKKASEDALRVLVDVAHAVDCTTSSTGVNQDLALGSPIEKIPGIDFGLIFLGSFVGLF